MAAAGSPNKPFLHIKNLNLRNGVKKYNQPQSLQLHTSTVFQNTHSAPVFDQLLRPQKVKRGE